MPTRERHCMPLFNDEARRLANDLARYNRIWSYMGYRNIAKWKPSYFGTLKDDTWMGGIEVETCDGEGKRWEPSLRATTALGFPCNKSFQCVPSEDGSISGPEFVFGYATIEFYKRGYNLQAFCDELSSMGYNSEKGGRCGQHCHVGVKYFTSKIKEQHPAWNDTQARAEAEQRLTVLIGNNAELLKHLSRRTARGWGYCAFPTQINRVWSFQYREQRATVARNVDNFRRSSHGHGACMNYNNENTLEFRFNRGTLNPAVILAHLEEIYILSYAARNYSQATLANLGLGWMVQFALNNDCENFINYLVKKKVLNSNHHIIKVF